MNSHTSLEQPEQHGFLNRALSRILNACVLGELNLVISGPGKSGRTTLLRALGQASLRTVFAPVPGQPRAVFQNEPACLGGLEQNGFDRADLTEAALTWGPA
ncbi:hypothetical protein [Streptomyces sp. NPDC057966]|uniref:hypothetical protein n=1 Tax=Streptomyces sp. NPDC057966 TaxID=3346292 RepID=UPI0036EB1C12